MSYLRAASWLLFLYAVLLTANALTYLAWSGDTSELTGLAVRVAGVSAIAVGLRNGARWAWWFGIVAGSLLGIFALAAVALAWHLELFVNRPYPLMDYAVVTACGVGLIGAVVLLLMPGARAVWVGPALTSRAGTSPPAP